MLSALRSIILHVWTSAKRAADATTTIDTFSEFQLRDIGLTRDNDSIRARAGDVADPWQHVAGSDPGGALSPQTPNDEVASPPSRQAFDLGRMEKIKT
ncbi:MULTISPECIES: hypothetical protein [Ensifer]|jgi:hypothetical protein|uniref:DUF1127 domain-containing protein n=1 Tax=Ensifer canadensis TaxID=555315 RepID=A0AAW4FGK5_9HYPH|nr:MULTISPECIES: hypothetical protein [Ensifer]KQU82003.1 hypothetical protein ASD00_08060 [Ensifer sp. Root31]KQW55088.1 hypothetical protein ASD03_21360 [Ensifer sp. Root127]KQW61932.1 hypothetical protein ASD02_20735 [Ensifer sp. Root1252]KRC83086.1 hypothetical protein ASE32_23780 [Ensifer sp. Root231]KRC84959.1 hypothetical protein ASE47_17940 [Ensifer sp. Root258]